METVKIDAHAAWNVPPNLKVIPYVVAVICENWSYLTK